ncbi:MAG TPA: hypothetical protein VM733_17525 [Thermoanaerobaculia bacterium]|nr:hypothetical protein [Thermoanaerobaculia bacterium]
MLNLIKQFLTFRFAQSSARGAVRMLGFGKLAAVAGIAAGARALWKYRQTQRHA